MTLFNSSRTKQASFKKAKFFFESSNIKGGIKFAEYEYPRTDRRDIEELGKMLKKITINGLVDCNVNYKSRDKLQQAFDEPEAGTLSLPFYKKLYGYVVEYSFSDTTDEVGYTKFTCEFVEITKEKELQKTGKGFISSLKSNILGKYEESFDKGFESVKNAKEKFDSATETLKDIANEVSQVATAVAGAGDSLGDFTTSINQIVSSANQLVQSPKTLFKNIKTAFDNLSGAFASSKDLFKACKNMFNMNEKDRTQIGNSQYSIDIRNNQNLLNQAVKINALTLAYQTSTDIDYLSTQEINDVINDLELGYSQLDLSNITDRTIIDNLHQMRFNAISELNEISLSVPNIIDYQVNSPAPLNNILYSLYGNDDNKDVIISINNFRDTSNISGTIKVLKYE